MPNNRNLMIVHLPCYEINPYQRLLMEAQMRLGYKAINGGEGGNFLRTALFKWKPSVIHFHWLHPFLLRKNSMATIVRSVRFILEVLILKLWGIRIIWTIHNLKNHDNHQIKLERFFSMIFARLCHVRIAHSEVAADKASIHFKLGKRPIRVIPHSSYVGLYPMDIGSKEARMKLDLDFNEKVLLFLGRINEYKGVFDLIDCLPSGKKLNLVVAGEPANDKILNRLMQAESRDSRIRVFPGRVPEEELQYYFKSADIVVFPYRDILTSGAVILAMSFGKFVVVPDMPVMRETVPERGGLFYKRLDMKSLSAAILESMFRDTDSGGIKNQERAKNWTIDAVAEMTIKAYYDN